MPSSSPNKSGPQRFVFLDRDGVINRDSPDYIKSWEEFEFLPGSIEAIRLLTQTGFKIIIITNQSIINRHMATLQTLEHLFSMMQRELKREGGLITDIFFCPHRPDENCACRKPSPGMILQAQKKHGIDLAASTMIGDSAKDIQCAIRAGCGRTILVQTGNGIEDQKRLEMRNISPDRVARDLLDAARWLIGSPAGKTR